MDFFLEILAKYSGTVFVVIATSIATLVFFSNLITTRFIGSLKDYKKTVIAFNSLKGEVDKLIPVESEWPDVDKEGKCNLSCNDCDIKTKREKLEKLSQEIEVLSRQQDKLSKMVLSLSNFLTSPLGLFVAYVSNTNNKLNDIERIIKDLEEVSK